MPTITLDIETVGTEDPAVVSEIAAGILPPGNYSKPETISKWEAESKPALVEDALKKTSFDGGLGRIVCIGWAVDDNDPYCLTGEHSEADMLEGFFSSVGGYRMPILVGHNISGFDLRFLWQRAVVHGIQPPSQLPFNKKPWDSAIADTMLMWNPDREKRTSLDKLCRILGVANPKTDLDGSKVWEYFKAGRMVEIAAYCKGDVIATRECYRRMTFKRVKSEAQAA